MAFWKKSEDPWDRKPKKQKPVIRETDTPIEPKEKVKNPKELLNDWTEKRRAAAQEEDAKKLLPPEKCPWCGQEMEQGFLLDSVVWYSGVYRYSPFVRFQNGLHIHTEDGLIPHTIAWHCKGCKKMVIDTTYSIEGDAFTGPFAKKEEQEEKCEESGD